MPYRTAHAAAVLLLLSGTASPREPVEAPKDELHGTWVVETVIHSGREDREFRGDRSTYSGGSLSSEDGDVRRMRYVLDISREPRTIAFMLPGRTLPHQWGIYRIDGDRLTMCTVSHDRKDGPDVADVEARRPTALEAPRGSDWWLIRLRKVR